MSDIVSSRLQLGIISTVVLTSVLALSQLVSAKDDTVLTFNPTLNQLEISFTGSFWGLVGGTEQQNDTLKRYQEYLRSKGINDIDTLRRASAILVHENENLTFDRTHDGNLGFGICGRYVGIHFAVYKKTHPEEVTPEAQIRWCGDRFISSLDKYKHKTAAKKVQMPDGRWIKTTDRDFRVWVYNNCPACAHAGKNTTHLKPPYFQRVQYSYEKLSLM